MPGDQGFYPRKGDCVWFASFYEALESGQQKQPNGMILRIDWANQQVCIQHIHQDHSSEVTWLEFDELYGTWSVGYNCWMLWNQ